MTTQASQQRSRRPWATALACAAAALIGAACHPVPVVVKTSSAAIGGTIAGVIHGPDDALLGDRAVSLVNTETGQRYDTKTGPNGGYSIRVPAGTYRLVVELKKGEQLDEEETALVLKSIDIEENGAADVKAGHQ